MTRADLTATEMARLLADFVDVLIPGDERWPTASSVGVQALLAARLVDLRGEDALDQLVDLLLAGGAPFTDKSGEQRTEIVSQFEQHHPALFGFVRNAVYLAYYESPAVVAAIRALGYTYWLRPHLEGYDMPPFDSGRDTPRHGRGFHVPTEAVRRLDLSGLGHLAAIDPTRRADGHG
jgi:hypothetical protein